LEHGQQGGHTPTSHTVADPDRKPDHGQIDETCDNPWQHSIHPGRHDEDGRLPCQQLAQRAEEPVQPCDAEIRFDARLEAAGLDHHPGLVRRREVGGARRQQPDAARPRLRREAGAQDSGCGVVADDMQTGVVRLSLEFPPVTGVEPADQALALLPGQRHRQSRRVHWVLAACQHHLGQVAAVMPAQVEPGSTTKLGELDASQLSLSFGLGQLAGQQPAKNGYQPALAELDVVIHSSR